MPRRQLFFFFGITNLLKYVSIKFNSIKTRERPNPTTPSEKIGAKRYSKRRRSQKIAALQSGPLLALRWLNRQGTVTSVVGFGKRTLGRARETPDCHRESSTSHPRGTLERAIARGLEASRPP